MAKGKKQIEDEADKARKKAVDEANKLAAKERAAEEAKLAQAPLNDEEKAFVAKVRPKMNEGRKGAQPSPADILRYSQLIKREGVK